jgi:hypothetical protein
MPVGDLVDGLRSEQEDEPCRFRQLNPNHPAVTIHFSDRVFTDQVTGTDV